MAFYLSKNGNNLFLCSGALRDNISEDDLEQYFAGKDLACICELV